MLLPPTSIALLTLVALFLGWRRLATALTVVVVALAVPAVPALLLNALAPPPAPPGSPPSAIVILSADAISLAGVDTLEPGLLTLDRLRAGAALQRETGLPVLVSGGEVYSNMSLASMMTVSLREDFRIPVRWEEGHSRDTWENAFDSAVLLKAAGITRVYVVTHFWHMRRALLAFRAAGLDPVAAPVRPPYYPAPGLDQILPRPTAWNTSYLALHEWLGLAYYSVRR